MPRDEIEAERKADISLMPEGLLDDFDQQQVADRIRYLRSPGQVPRPAGSPNTVP